MKNLKLALLSAFYQWPVTVAFSAILVFAFGDWKDESQAFFTMWIFILMFGGPINWWWMWKNRSRK